MLNKSNIFKILGGIIISLVALLVITNLLYIKTGCLNKNCVLTNILTIILLIWATAFWVIVTKYSNKNGAHPR